MAFFSYNQDLPYAKTSKLENNGSNKRQKKVNHDTVYVK